MQSVRSAIRAETRFSRCPKAAKATIHRKTLFRDRNQTINRTLFTMERRPDALRGCAVPQIQINNRNYVGEDRISEIRLRPLCRPIPSSKL